jgi:Na+-transporting NADH:ubiquinone oxidoreductase subunit F
VHEYQAGFAQFPDDMYFLNNNDGSHLMATVSINNNERILDARQDETLLQALTRNDVFVPSVCDGSGSCGYCRIMLSSDSGPLTPVEEANLTPEERKRGTRLACQVPIRNDIIVKIPKQLLVVKHFRGVVESKAVVTHDIARVKIRLLQPEAISFAAGQYIKLESRPYAGSPAVIRNYSIASAPSRSRHVELLVRHVPGGICSTWVFENLQENEIVWLSGPYGSFRLRPTDASIIFIAGGSGMAPILSMLRDMVEKGNTRRAIFFFGALTQADLYDTEELAALQNQHTWFSFVAALSNEPEGTGWMGERGLITDVVARHCADTSGCEAYLCGSPGMIDACIAVLKKSGMSPDVIYFDKFLKQ